LDLGSGTGFIAKNPALKNKKVFELDIAYEMLRLNSSGLAVNADIENLPFKEKSFDLVLSSLAFQWLNNIDVAVNEILRILKDDGQCFFSLIGDGSLKELKSAVLALEIDLSVNQFLKVEDLQKNMPANCKITTQEIKIEYNNLYEILAAIKGIGASYGSTKKEKNLTKKDFENLNSFYLKNFAFDNKVHVSWNVIYVQFVR
jgi:malonyl-CoA O-methyltransferase